MVGAFIFFITIAFNNFLNAVAVSDVALLKKESQVISYKQRIDIIVKYERLSKRTHNPVTRFLNKLLLGDGNMDLFSEKNSKTQQGMEFSNPRTSKHQWYTLEHE